MVERDLGTIPTTVLDDSDVFRYYFVRIDFKTFPPGGVFYCNRLGGFVGDIGDNLNGVPGGVKTWIETDFKIQRLSQTQNNILEVSAIDFANVDGLWSDWNQTIGLREQPIGIYVVWFDPADNGATRLGTYPIYIGQIDATQIAQRANLSLTPFTTPHSVIIPGGEYSPTCINFYKDEFCQYAGGLGTCDRTLSGPNGCKVHDNEVHFVGFPFLPAPNTVIVWGVSGQIRFQPG